MSTRLIPRMPRRRRMIVKSMKPAPLTVCRSAASSGDGCGLRRGLVFRRATRVAMAVDNEGEEDDDEEDDESTKARQELSAAAAIARAALSRPPLLLAQPSFALLRNACSRVVSLLGC